MNRVAIRMDPLDVLFFRDGRPFAAATRANTGLPMPQTLLGAVRLALLEVCCPEFQQFRHQQRRPENWEAVCERAGAPDWLRTLGVRGPWLARVGENQTPDVLVPVPAVLHSPKGSAGGELIRLRPLPPERLPGWNLSAPAGGEGQRPLWADTNQRTEPANGFLTQNGLRRFLNGQPVPPAEVLAREDLFDFDHRTGIGVDVDQRTAEESQIYGASFLALRPAHTARGSEGERPDRFSVCLYAELVSEADGLAGPLTGLTSLAFGGERRRVAVLRVDPVAWPNVELGGGAAKPLLVLTTPCPLRGDGRPEGIRGQVKAAAVPTPLAVSGWDLARGGPKPTRFAAPAGSVYFLDSWSAGLGPSLSERAEDQREGWGCYVKGVWTDG